MHDQRDGDDENENGRAGDGVKKQAGRNVLYFLDGFLRGLTGLDFGLLSFFGFERQRGEFLRRLGRRRRDINFFERGKFGQLRKADCAGARFAFLRHHGIDGDFRGLRGDFGRGFGFAGPG